MRIDDNVGKRIVECVQGREGVVQPGQVTMTVNDDEMTTAHQTTRSVLKKISQCIACTPNGFLSRGRKYNHDWCVLTVGVVSFHPTIVDELTSVGCSIVLMKRDP